LEGLRIIWERNAAARREALAAKTAPKAASKAKSKNGNSVPAPASRSR
jgi:hypothetical protein